MSVQTSAPDERALPNISNPSDKPSVIAAYQWVRQATEMLTEPLAVEDFVIQTMPDVSPAKWHLAHTTWFFETFLLSKFIGNYQPFHPMYNYLFNSYYNTVGPQFCRPRRGALSRPTVEDVHDYREAIDQRMIDFIDGLDQKQFEAVRDLVVLGLHHEQQHQELILTDIKHVLATNPLMPAYRNSDSITDADNVPVKWLGYEGGLVEIGFDGKGFAFDNEGPRHQTYLQPYRLASRLVTCGEFIDFIEDNGYRQPNLWLSDGWKIVKGQQWNAPMYWHQQDGTWFHYTLDGYRKVVRSEPVGHVSYFEADAFARWSDARLPSEAEWEHAAASLEVDGNFVEDGYFNPIAAQSRESSPQQMFGNVWEWTRSPYAPYPGYYPAPGALGEYNGKFMCNQQVLRGGSCATSITHIRPTYRNFFPPDARWQFMGLRLAKDN